MSELKNNLKTTEQPGLRDRALFGAGIWQIAGHLVGVSVVGGLIVLPFVSGETIQAMWNASRVDGISTVIGFEGFFHIGISACIWALLVIFFLALRPELNNEKRRFRATRGTVLTETLIVLPVALMLTFGLAQLAVMNVAGILANLASVQAGRAAWLWYPEAESKRQNITMADVSDKVRIQAALTMAPAAPADFSLSGTSGSELFKQMRGSLVGAQLQSPSGDAGNEGMTSARDMTTAQGNVNTERSFARALDGGMFVQRTARKFTFAYLATEVELISSGDLVGARIVYKQLCAFPVVSRIFGDSGTVGSRTGRYAEITREFTLHRQLESNEKMPRK